MKVSAQPPSSRNENLPITQLESGNPFQRGVLTAESGIFFEVMLEMIWEEKDKSKILQTPEKPSTGIYPWQVLWSNQDSHYWVET